MGHKGLGDRETQAAPFQQGVSWETISSVWGHRRVGEAARRQSVGLKGKHCLPTTTLIGSSAVMTVGIDQKENIIPEVSHINAKQAVMVGKKKKVEGCILMDTVLGDSMLPVLGAHQIAQMCITIKLSEPLLQLCSEAGSAENILSHFQMTFYAQ